MLTMLEEDNLPEDQLIELARQAKPVPVPFEQENRRGVSIYSTVAEFLTATGLKPGKNEVDLVSIYNAYLSWATRPMPEDNFKRFIKKIFNSSKIRTIKVNIHPITLMEKIKGMKNAKEKQAGIDALSSPTEASKS